MSVNDWILDRGKRENIYILQQTYICVWRRPGQNWVTWKTPSSRALFPLQEPVAVVASYIPHTQMYGMKLYECGRTQPLFRVVHDRGINKRSKPKGLRQY